MDWTKMKRRVKTEFVFYRNLAADPRTPWLAKVLVGAALAYLASPVDVIPDFIPILGHLDDVLLVPGLIWVALWLVPSELKAEIRAAATCGVETPAPE
jgi:uncharacterized membrane protein YkvA (DUF1232 family)